MSDCENGAGVMDIVIKCKRVSAAHDCAALKFHGKFLFRFGSCLFHESVAQ